MGAKTKIEWTDATWNPIRGCTRVSEGCRNCYAEHQAHRFSKPGLPYAGLVELKNGTPSWTGKIEFVEKHLLDPLNWKKPRRIFVNSMSDLFHENVTDEMRDQIFAVMALCPQHTFQVLTKRPQRMQQYLDELVNSASGYIRLIDAAYFAINDLSPCAVNMIEDKLPLANVWLGVSVEDQQTARERVPLLFQTPAAKRFISAEPLLGPLDMSCLHLRNGFIGHASFMDAFSFKCDGRPGLNWVIVGGESGAIARNGHLVARPMHPGWVRSIRDQCVAAGVPFFFKQWGSWLPAMTDGGLDKSGVRVLNCSGEPIYVGKGAAGAYLDRVEWKQFPEVAQ